MDGLDTVKSSGVKTLSVLTALSGAVWLAALGSGPWRREMTAFLGLFAAVFVLYLAAVHFVLTKPVPPWVGVAALVAGALFRLTIFIAPPTLSDDAYRYLWDGRVQAAGINPYRHAPDDPALAGLRTPEWDGINHKNLRTIYPPLAQAAFRLGAWLRPSLEAQKALFLLADLLTGILLFFLLQRWGLSTARVLIYAWNPLVIVEFSSSGHVDSLGLLFLVAGFLAWDAQKSRRAGALWGLGFLAKLGSGLLLPFMVLTRKGRRALPWFLFAVAAGYGFYAMGPLEEWLHLTGSLPVYARDWTFNAGLYDVLLRFLPWPAGALKGLAALVVVGFAVLLACREDVPPMGQAGLLFALALALSPLVYPWYVAWLVPFLCFYPSSAGLAFTGLAVLSYLVWPRFDAGLGWTLPGWVPWVEYGVPAVLAIYEFRRRAGRKALVIFMKAPVPGGCKTRLCPPLSPEEAAALYRAFCQDVLAGARRSGAEVWIAYQSAPDFPTPAWAAPNVPFFLQQGDSLGDRLIHSFGFLFDKGYRRVVTIGTDAPSLPSMRLVEAFAALRKKETVIGPSEDGGYYLVGLRRPAPGLFQDIPWSTPGVMPATLRALARLGMEAAFLPAHRDVDTENDLESLRAELRLFPELCPATRTRLWA
ncbi:MAG: TIGR04282 family arsenosugar biosynthesis glycosyltransferase [Elusimicrobia bacterium]|nr:TIGR04282 family arsenosugar biosynthesis glycosyltransferase [Elusimicrobiota bacterium]